MRIKETDSFSETAKSMQVPANYDEEEEEE